MLGQELGAADEREATCFIQKDGDLSERENQKNVKKELIRSTKPILQNKHPPYLIIMSGHTATESIQVC